jgi:hypothetical protein
LHAISISSHVLTIRLVFACSLYASQAPIDDKTKALLLAAIALLGGAGALASGRALVSSLQDRISSAGDQAGKLVIAGAFWLAVFAAARFVLEL